MRDQQNNNFPYDTGKGSRFTKLGPRAAGLDLRPTDAPRIVSSFARATRSTRSTSPGEFVLVLALIALYIWLDSTG